MDRYSWRRESLSGLFFERSYTAPTHKHHYGQVDFPVPSDMLWPTAGGVFLYEALPWKETAPAMLVSKKPRAEDEASAGLWLKKNLQVKWYGGHTLQQFFSRKKLCEMFQL